MYENTESAQYPPSQRILFCSSFAKTEQSEQWTQIEHFKINFSLKYAKGRAKKVACSDFRDTCPKIHSLDTAEFKINL